MYYLLPKQKREHEIKVAGRQSKETVCCRFEFQNLLIN